MSFVVNRDLNILKMHHKYTARIAGLLYFLFIATFILSAVIRNPFIVPGDAGSTLANIGGSSWSFRFVIISELVSLLFFLLAAWKLHILLKETGKHLALLFLLLNVAGVAVESINTINLFAVLQLAEGNYSKVFSQEQMQASVSFFLGLYKNGFMVAQLFFSVWLLPLGYLVFRSGFLPKTLGILVMLDFLFWLLYFFQYYLFPGFKEMMYISFPVAFVAEVSLTFWLLVKGVKENVVVS